MVYILDQVKALEEELLSRIKQQGLNVKPQIIVVRILKEFTYIPLNQERNTREMQLTSFHLTCTGDSSHTRCARDEMQSRDRAYY